MAWERTFAMLKPGVLSRRLAGEILSRIERKGFDIVALKMIRMSVELAGEHYAEHRDQDFYPSLVAYMTSGPVVALVLEGDDVVRMLRRFCGPTRAEDAAPGTIRGDYAMHTGLNLIHASDSVDAAEREIARFFGPDEIVRWQDGNIRWI